MHRTAFFFLSLLLVLNIYLLMQPRLLPLLESVIAINTAACCWFFMNSFAPPERQVAVRSDLQAVFIILLLMLDGLVFMGSYFRMAMLKRSFTELSGPPPSFNLTAFDGSSHKLPEFSGRPVILHFWGTWCTPCRKEFPKLVAYATQHPGTEFIAVDANDDAAKADVFAAKSKAPQNLMFVRDPGDVITNNLFKVPGFPTTILIDAQGHLRREYVGSIQWEGGTIDQAIKEIHLH